MSTLAEIERAIEALPPAEVETLAAWLESRRSAHRGWPLVEPWLEQARGTAEPGLTTETVLAMTRREE